MGDGEELVLVQFKDVGPPQAFPDDGFVEIMLPEVDVAKKKMGIGGRIDGPGDWKPDPNAAKNVREFIEKGGNADTTLDTIQDGDYHDLLDQMGGPEGF